MYLEAYAEGFTCYIIYVNVERFLLPTTVLSDPTAIRPLPAYPMERQDLRRLLNRNPITKEELSTILKSGQLTKAEMRSAYGVFQLGMTANIPNQNGVRSAGPDPAVQPLAS